MTAVAAGPSPPGSVQAPILTSRTLVEARRFRSSPAAPASLVCRWTPHRSTTVPGDPARAATERPGSKLSALAGAILNFN